MGLTRGRKVWLKSNSYTNGEFKSYFFGGFLPPTPSGVCDEVQVTFTAAHAVVDGGILFVAFCAVLAAATGVVVMEVTSVGPAVVVVVEFLSGSAFVGSGYASVLGCFGSAFCCCGFADFSGDVCCDVLLVAEG
jgi:hypothetical protein